MLSIDSLRKIDPAVTAHMSDQELEKMRMNFYGLGQLMFDNWQEEKQSSKNLIGLLTDTGNNDTL